MNRRYLLLALVLILLPFVVLADRLAGVQVPVTAKITGYATPLHLNGAGIRKKFFFNIYVAALYLPQAESDAAVLLKQPPPNRIAMHFVYDQVSRKKMAEAWYEGFEKNLSAQQFVALKKRLEQFADLFDDMRDGDLVWLDHVPGSGTRVSINGTERGVVGGDDFSVALLSVWLGGSPVTESLKKGMLGVDKHKVAE